MTGDFEGKLIKINYFIITDKSGNITLNIGVLEIRNNGFKTEPIGDIKIHKNLSFKNPASSDIDHLIKQLADIDLSAHNFLSGADRVLQKLYGMK